MKILLEGDFTTNELREIMHRVRSITRRKVGRIVSISVTPEVKPIPVLEAMITSARAYSEDDYDL